MHQEAFEGIRDLIAKHSVTRQYPRALDIGGQNVNGTVHTLLRVNRWDVLDIYPGAGVTIVADGTTWRKPENDPGYGLVISTETLEHVEDWQGILHTAADSLTVGGVFLGSWGSTGRGAHTANGQPWSPDLGEHYGNVSPEETEDFLKESQIFSEWDIVFNPVACDVYMWAVK